MNKINALRFNESGDFWSQKCVDKLDFIAKGLKTYGVVTYGYSARSDLDFSDVNFIIKGSGWAGPNGQTCVIDEPSQVPEGYTLCIADCRACNLCQDGNTNIAFTNHKSNRRHPALPPKTKGKSSFTHINPKTDNVFVAKGNAKIPITTAIINMGSAKTCPSKNLGLCQLKCTDDCYAAKAEKQYPVVIPARMRAQKYWLKNTAETILADLIKVLKLGKNDAK